MQLHDFTTSDDDIVVELRRFGRHFDVLTGLDAGPYFENIGATCSAAADEIERLREENDDRAHRYAEVLADLEAMNRTRLREGEGTIPTDQLPDDHRLGPRQ